MVKKLHLKPAAHPAAVRTEATQQLHNDNIIVVFQPIIKVLNVNTTGHAIPNVQSSIELNAEAAHWSRKHHLLYRFVAKFGHCRVPPGYGVGTEYEGLFEWVTDQYLQNQRMLRGEVTTMTPTRAKMLADVGCVFTQDHIICSRASTGNDTNNSTAPSSKNVDDGTPTSNAIYSSAAQSIKDTDYSLAPASIAHWASLRAEYKQIDRNCDAPMKKYSPNPSIGTSVNRQRAEYRKMNDNNPSSVTHEKVDELQRLGFKPNYPPGTFVIRQRAEYRKMNDNNPSSVTHEKVDELQRLGFIPNYPPGTFANHQQTEYRKMNDNKPYSMTHEKVDELQRLGFIPNYPHGTFANHQQTEYRKMNDNEPYSMTHEKVDELKRLGFIPNYPHGTFANHQQTEYRKMNDNKPSSMTQEKVTFAVRESRTSWEERFEELKAYKEKNGHANIPRTYSRNRALSCWVNEQRIQYRKFLKNQPSSLTNDRIKALNSLDFKWPVREKYDSWDNWLKELSVYKEEHGDVDVPLKYKPNSALGAFVNRQRTEYRKLKQGRNSSLNEKRIEDLNNMGFKWAIRVSRTPWETRLNELKEFKATHGHANVPSTYPPNQPLAYWVFKQRGQYRVYLKNFTYCGQQEEEKPVCHMTPDRIRMLNELGFEWNPPRSTM